MYSAFHFICGRALARGGIGKADLAGSGSGLRDTLSQSRGLVETVTEKKRMQAERTAGTGDAVGCGRNQPNTGVFQKLLYNPT